MRPASSKRARKRLVSGLGGGQNPLRRARLDDFSLVQEGDFVGYLAGKAHLEIEPAHEGEGLASKLIAGTLDAARAEGLSVLPFCPFVRSFIAAHKEYLDLVPIPRRAEFKLD